MLENLYMLFRIYPFGAPRIRAVKKEAKHYHWDWTLVKEAGKRFENLVACHLMNKPIHFIECKTAAKGASRSLKYLKKRFPHVRATQVLLEDKEDLIDRDDIRICPAYLFLNEFK